MEPVSPRSNPASLARAVSGRTPMAMMTAWAGTFLPEDRVTSFAWMLFKPSPRISSTPWSMISLCSNCAMSSSKGSITWGAMSIRLIL